LGAGKRHDIICIYDFTPDSPARATRRRSCKKNKRRRAEGIEKKIKRERDLWSCVLCRERPAIYYCRASNAVRWTFGSLLPSNGRTDGRRGIINRRGGPMCFLSLSLSLALSPGASAETNERANSLNYGDCVSRLIPGDGVRGKTRSRLRSRVPRQVLRDHARPATLRSPKDRNQGSAVPFREFLLHCCTNELCLMVRRWTSEAAQKLVQVPVDAQRCAENCDHRPRPADTSNDASRNVSLAGTK